MEHRTYYEQYLPRAPPSSPTKFTPLTYFELDEACPSTACALHIVDQKIEAHQAMLSPTQTPTTLGPNHPALSSDNASGKRSESSGEPMHRMTPLRQISSASDDDNMTLAKSSCRLNDDPSNGEVNYLSTATGVQYQRRIAESPLLETQPPSPKSLTFGLFDIRSSREAVAGTPSRFRFSSPSKNASESQPTFTGRHNTSLTPIGSSAISDIAVPLEYTQNKRKSWHGPCAQLQAPDGVSMPKFTMRSYSRKCDFTCASCGRRKARCDGAIPSCRACISGSKSLSRNEDSIGLRTLAEQARGEEAMDETQTATMEEERSHFSDDSTDDDDDDGDELPSNTRLFNSLGRLNQRWKPRLSWSRTSLFAKP